MLIIAGDWAPGLTNVDVMIANKVILANLEGPVLHQNNNLNKSLKAGPSLFTNSMPQSSTFIFSLANNHIMDYDVSGLNETIHSLKKNNIHYCGAGHSIKEAREHLVIEEGGSKIGIISCCEAQFGVARNNQTGVAEFGPWVYKAIKDLAQKVDSVIISVHAGVEDSPWPSPFIRDLYRSYIDAGATIIHGHHAHVPQGYEEYNDGLIFYGMGNFAVDPVKWWNRQNGLWSVGADMDLNSKPFQWKLKTFEIRHESGSKSISIEESLPEEYEHHMKYLECCNRPLHDDSLFDSLWQEVAIRAFYHYGGHYMDFLPQNSFGGIIKKFVKNIKSCAFENKTGFNKITQQKQLLYYHMLACESHRQMLTTALGVLSEEIKDLRSEESSRLADEMLL